MAGLQFAPWSSDIELSFYSALANLKINYDKLDDAARRVVGRYEIQPTDNPERSARMQVHGNAFTADEVPARSCRAEGIVKNMNTFEDYKNLDRTAIMDRAGRTIWDAISDGTIYSCPSLLSSFHAIFFADLKKYRFTYHFAFPALHSEPPWKPQDDLEDEYKIRLSAAESSLLFGAVQTWRYSVDTRQHGFFLAKRVRLSDYTSASRPNPSDLRPQTPKTPKPEDVGFEWNVGSLSSYENEFFKDTPETDRFVCFVDPSTYPRNPAWMLRNLLVLVRHRWHLSSVQILCYRDTQQRREAANSLLLRLSSSYDTDPSSDTSTPPMPKITGWERSESNKLTSRTVDLAAYLDPNRLADQSVDLNLKLMKWRIAPSLELDIIKETSCLLLGAGTLGSYVSRNLLGWGVRKITFIDNARVSYSNPVRQPLFNFRDCKDPSGGGGVQKATRAAEALKEIYPGVDSKGYVMNVPMAGHPLVDEKRTKTEFELLRKLIAEHDVVFLLMDTRESRWLPTVLGKSMGKIVLTAALGFDSYVVMRHGNRSVRASSGGITADGGEELGCYFCNDVVAPANSQKDTTLDQQCTVTRPGIAPIASALAVELLISTLQHPLRARAPAPRSRHADPSTSPDPATSPPHPLGSVPHTLRGHLHDWTQALIHGHAYDACSACSGRIVDAYEDGGWGFVRRALAEKGFVEEVSGLDEVQRRAEEAMEEGGLEWGDEDEDGDELVVEGEMI